MVGIPGLRGVEHIGVTVPDLEEADRFFVEVIGCQRVYDSGPRQSESDWMREHLGVHPRTVLKKVRFYRCRTGANFEIFEYDPADEQRPQLRNSDIGGHHVAFYVDDFDEALAHLNRHGVDVMGEPSEGAGASAGQKWIYFRAPWGMQFELVSYPEGKAYEEASEVKLWHPARPGN